MKTDRKEDRQEAARLYLAGENTIIIADHFGVHAETIRCWLHQESVKVRARWERSRKYSYRPDAFSIIDAESAYYAGLMMADGNIDGNRPLIQIEISREDEELLVGLRGYIGYDGPFSYRQRKTKKGRPGIWCR